VHPNDKSRSFLVFALNRLALVVRVVLFLVLPVSLCARQTDNHELLAVPAPGRVVVDGDLSDWDLSGRIVVCSDVENLLGKCSASVAMMYDAEALYVGVDWNDPTPMVNNYDPRFDIDLRRCFHSDSIQLHFRTDQERKVIGWYFTKGQTPGVCVLDGWFPWHDDRPIPYIDGLKQLGITEGFRRNPDGKGYVQEMRIPWPAIVKSGRPYSAGEQFDCMLDLVWGPESGKGWPAYHMMDLVEPGAVHTGWFWEVKPIYGKVRCAPAGRLQLPQPDFLAQPTESPTGLQTTEGPIALSYVMPNDGFATLVIEDDQGRRVNNLIGMARRDKGARVEHWDCTDESGQLVPPGRYRFRGLLHQGINPVYEATYGTPGNPPWDTADGTGAWMSDHCAPRAVAAGKGMVVLGAERAESGSSLIGVDLEGRKKWGDSSLVGVNALATDDQYAYLFLSAWDIKPALSRVDLATGRYAPFATPAGPMLKVPIFKENEKPVWIPGLTVGTDRIAMPVGAALRFYDKRSATIIGELPVPKLGCIACDPAGTFHVWTDGKIARLIDGKLQPFITTGLPEWAEAMAVDALGQVFLTERKAQQVRVYAKDGKFLRTIGRAGGRAKFGKWQPDGLLNPLAIAVDSQGGLWVTEENDSPKRVSVWSVQGKLLKDFIGPTGYGGTGANADPDDPRRVFGSGCEFQLDRKANRAEVAAALGPVAGQLMKIKGREYIMGKNGRLYLRQGDQLKPVAAMGNVCIKDLKEVADIPLPPAPAGTHGYATISFVWSDLNDDGKAEPEEAISGSRWSGWKDLKFPVGVSGYFGSYWLDEAFNLYGVAGESYGAYGGRPTMVTRIPLKGWTGGGAPIWDVAKQTVLSQDGKVQGCLYLPGGGQVIAGAPLTGLRDDGTVLWIYQDKWAGVHASHNAPIPERDDQLIGTLGCIGRAKTRLGMVFAMHSNMGRLYLMTTDGLLVASVFQDCRAGGDPWPAAALKGAPLGGVTMGSEWFGGHFFKCEKTGEYFLIAGFTAYNLIKLQGFESLQPIRGGAVIVSAADVRAAEELAQHRVAAKAAASTLVITKAATPPAFLGKLIAFPTNSFVAWSSGPYKLRAAIAADATNLYLAYDVSGDDNPMVNAGKDVKQLFTTGDSVDLQLGTDATADPKRTEPAIGDLRLLISVFEGKPVAVLYRWRVKEGQEPVTFTCPWRSHTVDRVDLMPEARINVVRRGGGYMVEAAVPLTALGFAPQAGREYKLDLGVIFSDAKGNNRAARVYWANKATGLVADVPGEIMATPKLWGRAKVAP
jgi:hypothetical protein